MIVRVSRALAPVMAGGLVLVAFLTGCAGVEPAKPANGVTTSVFDSREWKLSFRYPAGYQRILPRVDPADAPGLQFQVLAADPGGGKAGDIALDVFSVAVYRLSNMAGRNALKSNRGDFEALAQQLIGSPDDLRVLRPFAVSAIGHEPALTAEYGARVKGVQVLTLCYLVPKGRVAYWVTAQVSRATAGESDLVIALSSLRFQ